MSDGYHTCYVLSGLSSAQHLWTYDPSIKNPSSLIPNPSTVLASPYKWNVSIDTSEEQIFDEEDRVGTLHPVFVIPAGVAERTRAWFERNSEF